MDLQRAASALVDYLAMEWPDFRLLEIDAHDRFYGVTWIVTLEFGYRWRATGIGSDHMHAAGAALRALTQYRRQQAETI
jgi:hypothetical protein